MPNHNRPVIINRKLTDIASKYEACITCLYIDTDAIRIRYTITPSCSQREGMPIVMWDGYARDDQGGEYQSAGGASGSPDGEHTEGVLSFLPLPGEEVRRLDITMILVLHGRGTETKCEFSVVF